MVMGSSDFFGLNYYTTSLAEDRTSDIADIDYTADQDIATSYDPAWYG